MSIRTKEVWMWFIISALLAVIAILMFLKLGAALEVISELNKKRVNMEAFNSLRNLIAATFSTGSHVIVEISLYNMDDEHLVIAFLNRSCIDDIESYAEVKGAALFQPCTEEYCLCAFTMNPYPSSEWCDAYVDESGVCMEMEGTFSESIDKWNGNLANFIQEVWRAGGKVRVTILGCSSMSSLLIPSGGSIYHNSTLKGGVVNDIKGHWVALFFDREKVRMGIKSKLEGEDAFLTFIVID